VTHTRSDPVAAGGSAPARFARARAERLLVLAPLRVEVAALRTSGARTLRTGIGAARAQVAAARALAVEADAVAVAGVCAGVAPTLAAGDVVAATELWREDGPAMVLADPAPLVAALERCGLHVHVGPLLSVDRLTDVDGRNDLVASGALAVDMESAWLAAGADGRPLAVVRVVADAAGRSLLDPRMLLAGTRALLHLRRVAPALVHWAEELTETAELERELVALLPESRDASGQTGRR